MFNYLKFLVKYFLLNIYYIFIIANYIFKTMKQITFSPIYKCPIPCINLSPKTLPQATPSYYHSYHPHILCY